MKSMCTTRYHAADTGYDTPPHHSIYVQTLGRLVAELSIDVERHTGILINGV